MCVRACVCVLFLITIHPCLYHPSPPSPLSGALVVEQGLYGRFFLLQLRQLPPLPALKDGHMLPYTQVTTQTQPAAALGCMSRLRAPCLPIRMQIPNAVGPKMLVRFEPLAGFYSSWCHLPGVQMYQGISTVDGQARSRAGTVPVQQSNNITVEEHLRYRSI